nr:MAG TPA: Protein of unknown function (DUF3408) [Caudoviricetes sp.]DAX86048.1 MAG TPA: Protein of unknown function (DUF3408) [Caudoviricetes sp.]DAX88418.1 MAG TPA: Protein of unknown function (DUF3408) [Caudoviricetes sp.]
MYRQRVGISLCGRGVSTNSSAVTISAYIDNIARER